MKKLKAFYSFLLSSKSTICNVFFGNKKYNKFVIISRSRTGSTLLMALLRSHPDTHVEGELFKNLNGKSCLQIWNNLFSNRPKNIQQIGFKLFYYHPFDADKKVWDFLLEDKGISIIHLTRKNLLKAFVSQKIGEKTKQWTENINSSHIIDDKTIRLDPKECQQVFEKISKYEMDTREKFKDHETFFEVEYEKMASDKQGCMDIVFKNLNVKSHLVSTVLKKQNPESLKNLIKNYNELKIFFKDTKWTYLFNE